MLARSTAFYALSRQYTRLGGKRATGHSGAPFPPSHDVGAPRKRSADLRRSPDVRGGPTVVPHEQQQSDPLREARCHACAIQLEVCVQHVGRVWRTADRLGHIIFHHHLKSPGRDDRAARAPSCHTRRRRPLDTGRTCPNCVSFRPLQIPAGTHWLASPSPSILGTYGAGISRLNSLSQSTSANHACVKMSADPPRRLPYRFVRSPVSRCVSRSRAEGSK